jgi:hypothetical protein
MIVGTPTSDFAQAAVAETWLRPAQLPAARASVSAMLARLDRGQTVSLAGRHPHDRAQLRAYLQRLRVDLGHRPGPTPGDTPPPTMTTGISVPVTVTPDSGNPVKYPKHGAAAHDRHSWIIHSRGVYSMYIEQCDTSGGNCHISDQITASLVFNPGPTISRFDWNYIYTPDAGNFTHVHFQGYSICSATTLCSDVDSCDFGQGSCPTHGSFSLGYHGRDEHGRKVAHAAQFWAYDKPDAVWHSTDARTGNASCQRRPSNLCLY